jgi:2-amino-4-hydroxy-6-hydroxymethyldihydropteridine diphosphokinase
MTALLSLGSNIGDRVANIQAAVTALERELPHSSFVRAPLYETTPVDVPPEFTDTLFVNTALAVETSIDPDGLSRIVHGVEDALGRRRSVRHAPRTIDIDIIAFGDARSSRSDLRLPHPEAASRRFVLAPLADVVPGFVLPGQTRTIAELLAAMPADDGQGVRRLTA